MATRANPSPEVLEAVSQIREDALALKNITANTYTWQFGRSVSSAAFRIASKLGIIQKGMKSVVGTNIWVAGPSVRKPVTLDDIIEATSKKKRNPTGGSRVTRKSNPSGKQRHGVYVGSTLAYVSTKKLDANKAAAKLKLAGRKGIKEKLVKPNPITGKLPVVGWRTAFKKAAYAAVKAPGKRNPVRQDHFDALTDHVTDSDGFEIGTVRGPISDFGKTVYIAQATWPGKPSSRHRTRMAAITALKAGWRRRRLGTRTNPHKRNASSILLRTNPTGVITRAHVGKPFRLLPGAGRSDAMSFGLVQAIDVGKRYYVRDGIFQMENNEQRDRRLKRNPTRRRNGSDEVRELELFVENDGALYRQMHQPINKNLATKKARGVYNKALAVKGFRHLIDAGAKKYAKEFGGNWSTMFSVADRNEVAKRFVETFETEYGLGNYDELLPKKYQGGGKAKNPRFGGTHAYAPYANKVVLEVTTRFGGVGDTKSFTTITDAKKHLRKLRGVTFTLVKYDGKGRAGTAQGGRVDDYGKVDISWRQGAKRNPARKLSKTNRKGTVHRRDRYVVEVGGIPAWVGRLKSDADKAWRKLDAAGHKSVNIIKAQVTKVVKDGWRKAYKKAARAVGVSKNPGRGRPKRNPKRRFRDVAVGEVFEFDHTGLPLSSGIAKGPWVKLSARTYQHVDGGYTHRVGSVNAAVSGGRSRNPKAKLAAGRRRKNPPNFTSPYLVMVRGQKPTGHRTLSAARRIAKLWASGAKDRVGNTPLPKQAEILKRTGRGSHPSSPDVEYTSYVTYKPE